MKKGFVERLLRNNNHKLDFIAIFTKFKGSVVVRKLFAFSFISKSNFFLGNLE